ncbi:uncharacterized protein LOC117813133 [Notolabrus celidotus]|uniref:uncharacterized protein LOC117813133 n=1 Tax=Notolabrus celidotus TaxID=1203425 RepID=UPI00148FB1BE|nr:uncharacterized protein LOC117813133 [Notolabrus celidotus]
MTVWCQILVLLCCMLNLVESSTPSQVLQRNKYNNSFRLARSTRTRIQLLQKKYKEEKWWHKHFEDRGWPVNGLPSLSTDFYSWLNLTDWDRLHAAFRDLQVYWTRLERKRKELEMEEKEKLAGQAARPTLSERIMHIQLDLRDLMSKISIQMRHMRSSWTKPTSLPHLDPETSPRREWDSRPEGYIILRELDLYLTKLARDFLLLASKPLMTRQ